MKYLGLDYGTKWVGLAVSDESGSFAFPLAVWENRGHKDLVTKLVDLIKEKEITGLVLGESVNLDGSDNALMVAVRDLEEKLKQKNIKVYLQNETYTTAQSRRLHHLQEPRSRKQKSKDRLDAVAAALILQGWLERKGL